MDKCVRRANVQEEKCTSGHWVHAHSHARALALALSRSFTY